jgi:hypothetical protein
MEHAQKEMQESIIFICMCLLFLNLQFWKPNFWWESPRTKTIRKLLGDKNLDFITYASLLMVLVFSTFNVLRAWQHIRQGS